MHISIPRSLGVVALGLALPAQAMAGALVEGTWVTPDKAEMTIAECHEGYCGTLSKIVITDAQVAAWRPRRRHQDSEI